MKPAPFAYHRPESLEEVLALLAEHGDDAKLIAGGQSLVPMMNFRLVAPEHLIDLGGVGGLDGIGETDGEIVVGARVRHADLAASPLVRERCPLVAAAAETIGHWAIRQQGTIGGSLAHADPAAQLPLVAATLEAEIEATGPKGLRRIAAADFFEALMTTALAPDEVLTAVRFPLRRPGQGWSFDMRARRAGDFALVAVAATLTVADGRIEAARVGIGGVGDVPAVPDAVARALVDRPATAEAAAEAADAARSAVEPMGDPRVPAEFRRDLVQALTRRAVLTALARATESGTEA